MEPQRSTDVREACMPSRHCLMAGCTWSCNRIKPGQPGCETTPGRHGWLELHALGKQTCLAGCTTPQLTCLPADGSTQTGLL